MKKGVIIAGFSGIGKTTLAKKYNNVIDLDSAEYVYDDSDIEYIDFEKRKGMDRKPNPYWPYNYISKIKEVLSEYDYVLVWDRIDILEEYEKNKLSYVLCYPDKESLSIYKERFLNRGNSQNYIDKKIKEYDVKMIFFDKLNVEKIILHGNETLEDYLVKNNYL